MEYLKIENLHHNIANNFALQDVSLIVNAGQVVCIIGESGSGKTSLFRVISGLEKSNSGVITINGKIVQDDKIFIKPHKRNIGVIFQNQSLFPHMNVFKNIAFGICHLPYDKQRQMIDEVMQIFNIKMLEHRFPSELSGGQQQRVAIARAIVTDPKIILMDEPFASLDHNLRKKVRSKIINSLKAEKRAILLISHDPDETLLEADYIYIIKNGLIIESGDKYNVYYKPQNFYTATLFGEINVIAQKDFLSHQEFLDVNKLPYGYDEDFSSFLIRPDFLKIAKETANLQKECENGNERMRFFKKGKVKETEFLGHAITYEVTTDEGQIFTCTTEQTKMQDNANKINRDDEVLIYFSIC